MAIWSHQRGKQVKSAAKDGSRQTKAALIVQSISTDIASGRLKERDRLPAEDQLAARFKVSVGTVQKALGELARQRLIDREHGRGTFVAKTAGSPSELRYLRFCTRHGEDLPLFIHSHKVKTTRVSGPWSDFLGRAQSFIHIQRQINVGGRFDIFSEFILRTDEFAGAADVTLTALERKSLRDAFRQQFSLPTLRVVQRVGFEVLPAHVAKLLDLRREPGLVMDLLGYTTNDRPFCYQRVYSGLFDDFLVVTR